MLRDTKISVPINGQTIEYPVRYAAQVADQLRKAAVDAEAVASLAPQETAPLFGARA